MSKAEDLAEKLYPKKEHVAFGPLPCEEPNVIDDNKPYRIGFIAGYKQAEKDLELTWEDMMLLEDILEEMLGENMNDKIPKEWGIKEYYQDVLKRFKERRRQ